MTSDRIYVRPARAEVAVPYPDGRRRLPAAGDWVPRDTWWLRRLADGDVTEAPPPASAVPPAPATEG